MGSPREKVELLPVVINRETASRHVYWLNDQDVVQFSENRHCLHTIDSQLNYLTEMCWPHAYKEIWYDGFPVGTIAAHVDLQNSVANLGILLGDKTRWGAGIGTAAWQMMMDHLFERNIRKIEAGCMSINAPMCRIMQKTGMYEEGRRHGHFCVDGHYYDEVHYARFNARLAAHTAPTVLGQTAH